MDYVLGINAYHGDSSACLLADGELVAAAEEERFTRIKHWAGFPVEAIKYCCSAGNTTLKDITAIAINSDPRHARWRKLGYVVTGKSGLGLVREKVRIRKRRAGMRERLEEEFPGSGFRGECIQVEHHLAHLASAYYVSPFDRAITLSVDGFGDFSSAAWGIGSGTELQVDGRVYFPHSLGIFYQALTQFLGFPHYGDEYKVMGLAPYGEPRYMKELSAVVFSRTDGLFSLDLKYFRHHREPIGYDWERGAPKMDDLFSDKLEELIGPKRRPEDSITQRHKDLAASVQNTYETALFKLIEKLSGHYGDERLVLSGGCAMNSVANGRLYEGSPIRKLYVQSAAGDAGGAIGAALVAWQRRGGDPRKTEMTHAYWGPDVNDKDISLLLKNSTKELAQQGCEVQKPLDRLALLNFVARRIAQGQVIGWCQGRMEWGARALGNRSILCDPRRRDMKDILNVKIKRRESFRPFAPSIMREAVADWFETDDDVPFMTMVFQVRQDKRAQIPAVTHVDGSGRLQTVSSHTNPLYYDLISTFYSLTGVPILLNTSFNENEPIVCRPAEALDCFLRTRMDVLVLGESVIARKEQH